MCTGCDIGCIAYRGLDVSSRVGLCVCGACVCVLGGGGGGYRVCSGRNDSCIVAAIVCFLVELVCLVIWYVNFLCGSVVLAG